jgi:hypothetical protein
VKKIVLLVCCALVTMLVVSCSLTKVPAQAAITAAEATLNAVKAEAVKYLPEQVVAVEKIVTDSRAAFEKGDYKTALASAKDVPAKVTELMSAVEAKKAELPNIWKGMAASLPKLIADTKTAVAKARGLDKAVNDAAKTSLTGMETNLTKATDAAKAGNLIDAVNIGTELQNSADQIKASLVPPVAGK